MKKIIRICAFLASIGGFVVADDLAYISVNYCDTPENILNLKVDPTVETGICYTISNSAKKPVTVKVSFVDGTFTNDQRQNKACLSDKDTENFGRYVRDYDEIITLKPGEAMRKEAKLMYPQDMDGLYYGCLVYSVVEEKNSNLQRGNFTILMRKAKFIDVIVGDPANAHEKGIILEEFTDEDGENLSHNPKIRVYQDNSDGKYIVQLKVKNISRVQQDVQIDGVVNNILGTKFTFTEERKILRGETLRITKKLEKIPLYNLRIKLAITNTPMTFGDIKPILGYLKEKTTIRIWDAVTFITLGGLLVFGLIVFLLIKDIKKRRNVIVKVVHDKIPVQKPAAKKLAAKKPVIKKATTKKILSKKAKK